MEREQPYRAPGSSLGDIWAAVMRKGVTAAVVFAITVVTSGVLSALWPKSYEGAAVIAVSPLAADPTREIEINIDTEAVIVTSRRVITAAAEKLGVNAKELQERTTVAIPTDSNALEVTVTSDTAEKAADEANAVANAYLSYRAQQSEALVRKYVQEGLDTQIEALLNGLATDASAGDRSMVQQRVATLREKKAELIASAPGPGEVVSRAAPPTSPSTPGLPVFLGAGVVMGALLSAAAALLHDRLDPRVRSAKLLARHVPCRVLDSAQRRPALFQEHVVYGIKAVRREAGTRAEAPTVVVCTEGAVESAFVKNLEDTCSSRGMGPMVVVPQPGTVGVAQAVAGNAAESVFVVACRSDDRFPEVMELVSSLEEWSRTPSLVLMLAGDVGDPSLAKSKRAAVSKGSEGPEGSNSANGSSPAPRTARFPFGTDDVLRTRNGSGNGRPERTQR